MKSRDSRYNKTELQLLSSYLSLKEKDRNAFISVKDICNNTSVNRGTFYIHHKSMEEFIVYLEDRCYEEIEKAMEIIYSQIHFTSEPLFDMIDNNRDLFRYFTFYSCGSSLDRWTQNLMDNIRTRGTMWKDISDQQLQLMVNFLIGGTTTYFVNFYQNEFENKRYLINSLDTIVTKGTRGLNQLI